MSARKSSTRKSTSRHSRRSRAARPALKILLVALGAAILMAAGGFSFAASKETHDNFCASCHTQPETTYYQRSQDAVPTDLASAHTPQNTRCIDCHSGSGLFGRLSAEMLGAHNALAYYSGTAIQPAPLTRPVSDASCLKCHASVVSQRATQDTHFHVFLPRWQQVDSQAATCVSCHKGHSTTGSADIMFLERSSTQAVCDACHRVLAE